MRPGPASHAQRAEPFPFSHPEECEYLCDKLLDPALLDDAEFSSDAVDDTRFEDLLRVGALRESKYGYRQLQDLMRAHS